MAAYITRDKDMVDAICFRHYGSHDGGEVERVLEANRGLSDQPPILPAGLAIELPDFVPRQPQSLVRLWD